MSNRVIACMAVLVLATAVAWAQPAVRVESVQYEIEGRTLKSQLSARADFPEGAMFASVAEFELAASRLKQRLLNERVLEEVNVSWVYGEAGGDGVVPVAVQVAVRDTWNIIALPYFRYDSNSGLLLSVRGRDYNFLGSMQPLRLNLNYEQDEDGEVVWGADLDFIVPFELAGLDWDLGVASSIGYYEDGNNPSWGLMASLGSDLPLGPGILDFSVSQAITGNGRASSSVNYLDELFLTSKAGLGWRYTLATDDQGLKVVLRPKLGLSYDWDFNGLEDPALDRGLEVSSGVGLSWGNVDWIGNFRQGKTASLDLDASFWPESGSFDRSAGVTAALYDEFDWFGLSLRGDFFYNFDGSSSRAGSYLRGILNSRARTDTAFTFNIDLPVRIIRFLPAQWFGKEWLRYFEFEQHWSPFIDISQGNYDDSYFLVTKGWYAGGLEVITYPLAMRSFFVRVSLGWDLVSVAQLRSLRGASPRDGESIWELFIGMGLHY